ncbi:MAG: thiol reductant ABC exporter subunit CydC [Roseibium sp.]
MRSIWAIIVRQYRHNRIAFLLGLVVALVPAIAGVLLLGVSGWFITAAGIAGATGVFLNIFAPSAIIRALAILRTGGRYGERMLTHDATFRFLTDLRNRLFSALAQKNGAGDRSGLLLNRLTLDIAALDTIYLRLVVPFVLSVSISIVLLAVWAYMPIAVLLCGCIFLLAWIGIAWSAMNATGRKESRRADAASDAMRLRAADLAAGRRDLAVYGGLEPIAETIILADRRLETAEEIEDKKAIQLAVTSSLIGQLFLAAMLGMVVFSIGSSELTPAVGVGLVLVVMALPEIFGQILPGLARLPRISLAASRIETLLTQEKSDSRQSVGSAAEWSSDAGLRFENVSYRYPGADKDVLTNLSFAIKPGETLAIAGRSGCGKSTVAALASRLRMADSGQVNFNGVDILGIPDAVLRKKVTVLSQRPYLFNDTVAANLRIAKPDATETELWIALAQAALATRVSKSENGLMTVLGEGGLGLSGGEQRRLALARAFLTSPDFFVLDEMTEGLDEETALDVLERFLSFKGNAAVLMIAHKRLELESADRILPMPHRKSELAAE